MVEQFRDHLHDLALPGDVVEKIDKLVGDNNNDMEQVIDIIDGVERGYQSRRKLGETLDESEIVPYVTIRQEAEWFVQHCCEQIRANAAVLMWSPTLRYAQDEGLTIATTNYDRAVEIAAARLSINLVDGFREYSGKEYAQWVGFEEGQEGIQLLKLHGSTDWYRTASDEVFKLRHPMPLFGELELHQAELEGRALVSGLILPSREKLTTLFPFPASGAFFRHRAKRAEVAVFLGSSLRDPHMRDVCVDCAKDKPTFVVSRSGVFAEGTVPEGARVIREGAARFLMTTFPEFLRTRELGVLETSAEVSEPDSTRLLHWLASASDTTLETETRCKAIESIADATLSLHVQEIETLLRSEDVDVATYALGLISTAYEKSTLRQIAQGIAKPGTGFHRELETLLGFLDAAKERSPA
ncbi:SIR2 family protein [Lentisalinibacter orientalis]|uniref:SIR2 family protein n=1 Tax=Lentisalinibacter orientalis TaxID=2992241 RepID=UPI003868607F